MKSFFVYTIHLLLLTCLFGGASIRWFITDKTNQTILLSLRYALIYGSIAVFLFIIAFFLLGGGKLRVSGKATFLVLCWILFAFFVIIMAAAKRNLDFFMDGVWFLIGVPVVFFAFLPTIFKEHANELIAKALFMGHIPYVIFITSEQVQKYHFSQIGFENANSVGTAVAICSVGIIIISYYSMQKKYFRSWVELSILIAILLLNIGIIFLAKSRVSLLVSFMLIGIVFTRGKLSMQHFLKAICITLFFLGVAFLLWMDKWIELIRGVVDETNTSLERAGLLAGRLEIWMYALRNTNIVGHSEFLFESTGRIGVHNSFLSVWFYHGAIAGFFFTLFVLLSILYAHLYHKRNRMIPYSITPFVVTIFFWVTSLTQEMFASVGSGITMALFLTIGVINRDFVQRGKKTQETVPIQSLPMCLGHDKIKTHEKT